MLSTLLPQNSTEWERGIADAMTAEAVVDSAIEFIRGAKFTHPLPNMLPYLVWEFGLGELTPYVPNLYELIQEGVAWQRVRGTPLAIEKALGWLGYAAALEEAPTSRNWWNAFQLIFTALSANDSPTLAQLSGVTGLSAPARSQFRRGVFEYDVRELVLGNSRLGGAMLGDDSGVPFGTVPGKWSFGRTHEVTHTLTEAEGSALDIWVPLPEGGALAWGEADFYWGDADFYWGADGLAARASALAGQVAAMPAHVALLDAADAVIGYRRARAVHPVSVDAQGAYAVGGVRYAPSASGSAVYVEAMTAFGDGAGDVAKIALALGGTRAGSLPPGRLWLGPDDLIAPVLVAEAAVAFPIRPTVRERAKFLLRF
ncbi:MAG: phage tail protein [Alphaproteobacteria bacterium]|nr:phage tail protein [Alphaproteobacteria bacterium]